MITCLECIEGMLPDDPRVRGGKYNRCGCDYCEKPDYYREIEKKSELPEQSEVIHRHINYNSDVSKKQWGRIDAISGELKYLRQKDAEMMLELDKMRKPKEAPF